MNLTGLKCASNALTIVMLLCVSLLAGCTVKPQATLTPEARRPQTVSSIESLSQYTTTDLSADEVVADQWWRVIGDAEINTLVDELRVESLTLKETRSQIAQARELALQARSFRCLLYTSPSPRDRTRSRMPSSA